MVDHNGVLVEVLGDVWPEGDAIQVEAVSTMGWTPPWPWYPNHLPHWGLRPPGSARARAWYAGVPKGQERRTFETLIEAMRRGRRVLSPLTEETLSGITRMVPMAVLTTPG